MSCNFLATQTLQVDILMTKWNTEKASHCAVLLLQHPHAIPDKFTLMTLGCFEDRFSETNPLSYYFADYNS